MTTLIAIITTPGPMTLIGVDRVQTHNRTINASPDRAMRDHIVGLSPVWPGPGENGDRHVPVKANPGGAYLGSF